MTYNEAVDLGRTAEWWKEKAENLERELAAAKAKIDELDATLGDEEHAHQDTLRLRQLDKVHIAELEAALKLSDECAASWRQTAMERDTDDL